MEDLTVRLRISGKVQGVGFRYFTKQTARKLNVAGWVKNEPDGTVTVEARGDSESLEKFVHSLKDGPRSAEVASVEEKTIIGSEIKSNGFEIRY